MDADALAPKGTEFVGHALFESGKNLGQRHLWFRFGREKAICRRLVILSPIVVGLASCRIQKRS